jgi:AcrR family transcriptional regulator
VAAGQGATATSPGDAPERRRRNATETRRLLLQTARRRFARDGYAATTVRDIADDAGVNVALINRYFTSKEGLFQACLTIAVSEVREEADSVPLDEIAAAIAHRVAGSADDSATHETLLLLLRTSGDERADEMRRAVLRTMSERLAGAAGGTDEATLLRAQILLAATLGITVLRSTLAVQPLAGVTADDLVGPLADMVRALLPPR